MQFVLSNGENITANHASDSTWWAMHTFDGYDVYKVTATYPGLANAVAVGIDSMNPVQVLGCVAGDDTIIVVARDEDAARELSDRVRDLMKSV